MREGAVHGGISGSSAGEGVLDFSANLNPLGPPEEVLEAARSGVGEVERYPEQFSSSLRERYGSALGVEGRNVLFGCGSTELLFLAAALVRGGNIGVESPGFAEQARAAEAACASVSEVDVGLSPSVEDYHEVAGDVDACFVCTPHNPTGASLEGVRDLVEDFPNTLFILDRAFADFEPRGSSPRVRDLDNAVEVFSLTKVFSIPGLRAGYLVASPDVVSEALRFKQPWTLSRPAAGAAEACLELDGFVERSRGLAEEERSFLRSSLGDAFDVAPSDANFLLVEVGDASRVRRELLDRGLLVRDCSSFGLPGHVRIAVRGRKDNERLVEGLLDVGHQDHGGDEE